MPDPDSILQRLEAEHGREWMVVGMQFIRSVTIIEAHLSDTVDRVLQNSVKSKAVIGDSFARLRKLAFGLGVVNKTQYDALCYLGRIRNKWAHEEDVDVDMKDLGKLTAPLSSKRKQSLEGHLDNRWGHFSRTCELLCEELLECLDSTDEAE